MNQPHPIRRAQDATESHYLRAKKPPVRSMQETLAERGIRLTAKRKAILQILEQADQHLDAAGLLKAAQQQLKVDRATVYRTLDLLKRQGLIDELDLMHMRGEMHYYEARTDEQEHFHFVCFSCGKISEVQASLYSELKHQVELEHDVQIEVARLEIGGYCKECKTAHKHSARGAALEKISA